MNIFTRIAALILTSATLLAAGCGGGGGGGGGGGASPPPAGNPPPTGGNTRTGVAVAVGPITGFGSVWVNGVKYETDGETTYIKDGVEVAEQSEFEVGEMVVIKGAIDDNNMNATADVVESNDIVEGPVSSHDTTTSQIVVLGQTVQISATTSIDDSCPTDLTSVPAVEVYGTADSTGLIDATRIECRDGTWDGVMEVNGFATNVTATTFDIFGLTINYATASVDDFPTVGVISENDPIEAKGTAFNEATTTLTATRVEYKGNRFEDNEGDHIEIEGFITRFVSASNFDVSGIPVTTDDNTLFEGGDAGQLNENLKVEVEGEFDGNGVLLATKVEIKTATAVRVTGALDSVSGDTLVILGITVNTSPALTRFEDKSSADVDPMNVGDLNDNDYVEIRGQEQPQGQITAMIVERDDPDTRTELRGFVETKADPNLTVLGVTIVTNGGTVYKDSRGGSEVPMDRADFWAAVEAGSMVDARGTETDTTTLTATELELEMQ